MVIDGVIGPAFDMTRKFAVFTPDSRHVLYQGMRARKWFLVVDHTAGDAYDGFLPRAQPVFEGTDKFYITALRNPHVLLVEGRIVERPKLASGPDSSLNDSTQSSLLRFDGVYQSEKEGAPRQESWGYLRFYRDGVVIEVFSTGTPTQISRWFRAENASSMNLLRGRYEIRGNQLSFSVTSDEATLNHKGTIQKGELVLDGYRSITNRRDTRTHKFVPISDGN